MVVIAVMYLESRTLKGWGTEPLVQCPDLCLSVMMTKMMLDFMNAVDTGI